MNCEEFGNIVSELAAGKPMDATRRVTGLSHAAICAGCAQELRDVRALSTGLQMAVSAETEAAPARVREALLTAFAEHQKGSTTSASVIEVSTRRSLRWWSAAAAAVVLFSLMLPSLVRVFSPAPPIESARAKETLPLPTETRSKQEREESVPPAIKEKPVVAQKTLPRRAATPARKTPLADSPKLASETIAKHASNEYFPLTYLASATAMESGTVMRIQLSRSALISLGLPLNIERTDKLIKADLVVGDDGVARAIRLVQ